MNKNINKTGYLKGGPTEDNDYNIIPGGDITMKNVDKNLIAIKLDKKGKPIGMEFMKPGKDYEFDDTYSVLEVPQYQVGGAKNPFLPVDGSLEGLPQKTLNDLYNQVGFSGNPANTISLSPDQLNDDSPIIEQPFDQLNAFKGIPTEEELEMSELEATTQELNAFSKTLPDANAETNVDFISNEVNKDLGSSSNEELTELEPFKQSEFDNIQFFNPYGGVDIPTAATTLGQSISNKDTLGTVASSVKLAAGLGRNVLGGLGAQKRTNATMKDYYKKLREDGNVTSLQSGGSYAFTDNSELIEELNNILPTTKNTEPKPNIDKGFSNAELADINKGTGIEFTAEGANSLFEREDLTKSEPTVYPDLDLGRYGSVKDYYNVKMNGDRYVVTPGRRNFKNAQNYKEDLRYLQKLNPNAKFDGYNNTSNYIPNSQRRPENFQDGGMKKEELLTGEFITGIHEDDKLSKYTNAEIEKGEYFATKEGDIAEVKGNKHASGGEKIIMEGGDRVLTDHTKLGASNAKMIRDKFDIQVKAKNTYADVLDKYRTKSGMSKLIKEEEGILKKIEEQKDLEDSETKNLNDKFLQEKLGEVTSKKSPLEEGRKFLYNELYTLQEKDKPKSEQALYQAGGTKEEELPEYLGVDHLTGEGIALDTIPEGQSITEQGFFGGIDDTGFAKTKAINPWFDWSNFDPSKSEDVKRFQTEYNKLSNKGSQVTVDGKFGQQTQSIHIPWLVPEKPVVEEAIEEEIVQGELPETTKQALNALLLPDQYPMVPEGTQPALKNVRRYDRVEAAQIDPTKYLQEIGDQRQVANRQTEGLTPNVQAAALANIDANTQKAISDAMLRIDTTNIQSKNQAEITNARIQGREEDARVADNLSFEKRQLTADAKTDLAFQEYFDKVREVNLGNFRQVNAINNANARHDNIQFDGNGYIVRDAPDFTNTLNATQLAQMNTMLEEYEKSKK